MSTKIWYLSGKVAWLKREPDKYGKYTVDMYLDPESQSKYDESGLKLKERVDKDGNKYYQFYRRALGMIKGQAVEFGPPDLLDKDNNGIEVSVGNGSTATLKVSVYDSQNGKGHRVEAIRLDDLIEYNSREVDEIDNPF